jgi:hypothetical protein
MNPRGWVRAASPHPFFRLFAAAAIRVRIFWIRFGRVTLQYLFKTGKPGGDKTQ